MCIKALQIAKIYIMFLSVVLYKALAKSFREHLQASETFYEKVFT